VATEEDGVVVSGFNPSFMDGIGVDIGEVEVRAVGVSVGPSVGTEIGDNMVGLADD
jgi:hypothetical protein